MIVKFMIPTSMEINHTVCHFLMLKPCFSLECWPPLATRRQIFRIWVVFDGFNACEMLQNYKKAIKYRYNTYKSTWDHPN